METFCNFAVDVTGDATEEVIVFLFRPAVCFFEEVTAGGLGFTTFTGEESCFVCDGSSTCDAYDEAAKEVGIGFRYDFEAEWFPKFNGLFFREILFFLWHMIKGLDMYW